MLLQCLGRQDSSRNARPRAAASDERQMRPPQGLAKVASRQIEATDSSPSAVGVRRSDVRRRQTQTPAHALPLDSAIFQSRPHAHLLASSILSGGALRSLAAIAGMMTVLGISPAFAQ